MPIGLSLTRASRGERWSRRARRRGSQIEPRGCALELEHTVDRAAAPSPQKRPERVYLPREVFFFGFAFVEPAAVFAAAFFAVFLAGIASPRIELSTEHTPAPLLASPSVGAVAGRFRASAWCGLADRREEHGRDHSGQNQLKPDGNASPPVWPSASVSGEELPSSETR